MLLLWGIYAHSAIVSVSLLVDVYGTVCFARMFLFVWQLCALPQVTVT